MYLSLIGTFFCNAILLFTIVIAALYYIILVLFTDANAAKQIRLSLVCAAIQHSQLW